jgi:hypothetical protein
MLMMMSPEKKSSIAGSIMEKFVNGKKVESSGPKEYSESCKLAAHELLSAIESKDLNRIISAFIALDQETESYELEEG